MDTKLARIFCFIPVFQIVFWLIAFFAVSDRKEIGSSLTQGLIAFLCGIIPVIGTIVWLVLCIWAIIQIAQTGDNPKLPVIGGLNFFK